MDEDLLGGLLGSRVAGVGVGWFDELAVDECGAGAEKRDEVEGVDRAPAGLGGLDELVGHGQPGGPRAVPAGELGAVPDSGEVADDRFRDTSIMPL